MKSRKTYLIIIIIAVLYISIQSASAEPIVSVEPSYVNVLQGTNFTVNITIDPDGFEVMGAQYNLSFNNLSLNAINQDQGPFLSQDGASTIVFRNIYNNTIGVAEYGESRMMVQHGVTTPGILATIEFTALEPGICSLGLYNVEVSDPFSEPILGYVNNGTVEISDSSFIISGFVYYNDGSEIFNPNVTITNLNTSEVFIAQTNESSNYYKVQTDFDHIDTANVLHFHATDNLGNVSEFDHTVTQNEIDTGGFVQDITIYVPDTTSPVITNITVISKTKNSATITWDTDELSDSLIKYGTEPGNYIQTEHNATDVMHHTIKLTGLISNTTYYYVVNSTDPGSNSAQSEENNLTTFAEINIRIDDAEAMAGENVTTSIMISNIVNVGTADILITYNQSVVNVNTVDDSDFDFMDFVIDNSAGTTRIGAFQTSSGGLSGSVRLANVTLAAIGTQGSSSALCITLIELKEATSEEIPIPAAVYNGTFTIAEVTPPQVINPQAAPLYIPEDTDLDPRWGESSQLNITVIDDCGVAGVTINLSSIGGLPDQDMTHIPGTDIWTVTTNASTGTALSHNETYLPHNLTVCAEDIFGNVNTSVSIQLVVIKNGDVSENGELTLYDAMYLARHILGKSGYETMNGCIGEVSGNGALSLYDAMYLAKHILGELEYGVLH